jgi:transcriptional regulator with XRE-family HTH domain
MQSQITELIIKQMKLKGVTQSDLADELNCTQTAISNLLNGKSRLTIDDLDLIARKIGIPIGELITEANQYNNSPINIPNKSEEIATENALSFYLINRLRIPTRIEDLFEELKPNEISKKYIQVLIDKLQQSKIIEVTKDKKIHLNLNTEKILHYRLTEKYSERLVDIYKDLRPLVSEAIKNQKNHEKWKERNLDAFYCEYFTDEQIKKQNEMQRDFLNLVKHQIRINNASTEQNAKDIKELRVIYSVLAPYPIEELKGE